MFSSEKIEKIVLFEKEKGELWNNDDLMYRLESMTDLIKSVNLKIINLELDIKELKIQLEDGELVNDNR
jgi:hypothetical protein|tara:strand:+ start:2573 stop:2779 length:207 start_codon:yes stop_codon:yes gene_type:complete